MTALIDSSAWIEFLRRTGSPHHLWLRESLSTGRPLAWTEPVLLELTMGVRTGSLATDVRRLLARGPIHPVATLRDWEDAAALYRAVRLRGHTIRAAMDCLIAAVAIRTQTPLLARDRDFEHIAQVSDLQLVDPRREPGHGV